MNQTTELAMTLARSALEEQAARIAELEEALRDAQRAINSMKVEAETAAQGDKEMMLDACGQISREGLDADMAIRSVLNKETNRPASLPSTVKPFTASPEGCEHDWHIWPETDGQEQRCWKCGMYRETPRA